MLKNCNIVHPERIPWEWNMKVLQLFLMLRQVGLTGSRRVLRARPPKLEAEQKHEQQDKVTCKPLSTVLATSPSSTVIVDSTLYKDYEIYFGSCGSCVSNCVAPLAGNWENSVNDMWHFSPLQLSSRNYCVTRDPLLRLMSWVALSFKVCVLGIDHSWPNIPLFNAYEGINIPITQ